MNVVPNNTSADRMPKTGSAENTISLTGSSKTSLTRQRVRHALMGAIGLSSAACMSLPPAVQIDSWKSRFSGLATEQSGLAIEMRARDCAGHLNKRRNSANASHATGTGLAVAGMAVGVIGGTTGLEASEEETGQQRVGTGLAVTGALIAGLSPIISQAIVDPSEELEKRGRAEDSWDAATKAADQLRIGGTTITEEARAKLLATVLDNLTRCLNDEGPVSEEGARPFRPVRRESGEVTPQGLEQE